MTPAILPVPHFKQNLYSNRNLVDPYPIYKELRDLGPFVWLAR